MFEMAVCMTCDRHPSSADCAYFKHFVGLNSFSRNSQSPLVKHKTGLYVSIHIQLLTQSSLLLSLFNFPVLVFLESYFISGSKSAANPSFPHPNPAQLL